jgi:hypothetical protein
MRTVNKGSVIDETIANRPVTVKQVTADNSATSWPLWQKSEREYREAQRKASPTAAQEHVHNQLNGLDIGGEFYSEQQTYERQYRDYSPYSFKGAYIGSSTNFRGFVLPGLSQVPEPLKSWPTIDLNEKTQLAAVGSTAISRTKPLDPTSNAATFFGEMFLGGNPRMLGAELLRNRAAFFRSLGSEYLNVEFGWKPFISDLRKFLFSVKESDKILNQVKRDSGKVVRRKYRFPEVRIRSFEYSGTYYQEFEDHWSGAFWALNPGGAQSGYREAVRNYWFSGAYRYYLAPGDSRWGKIERYVALADKLLGVRITPEVLWELAPWSWLVDWVSNVGDVISNLSTFANDGTVLKYGYVMGDVSITDYHASSSGVRWANGTYSGPAQFSRGIRAKMRQRATPYGFGLDPSVDFTARQWAIIAALGLTKGDKVGW